jgi:hypothetical protein
MILAESEYVVILALTTNAMLLRLSLQASSRGLFWLLLKVDCGAEGACEAHDSQCAGTNRPLSNGARYRQ